MSSDIEADSCADAHWEYEHYPAFMFKFMHLIWPEDLNRPFEANSPRWFGYPQSSKAHEVNWVFVCFFIFSPQIKITKLHTVYTVIET